MEARYYDRELGIDGTIDELIDWSYRYDKDYSNEALEKIADLASSCGVDPQKARIPLLVLKDRERMRRNDGTLPYEQMILDHLIYGKVSFSETDDRGEIMISEDRGDVLISIAGEDDNGSFTAGTTIPIGMFMSPDNESNWLESLIGRILNYNRIDKEESNDE